MLLNSVLVAIAYLLNYVRFCQCRSLQTIAAYLRFLGRLGKLQGKVVTHSQGFEWWRILTVECVAVFWLHNPPFELSTLKMVHCELIYNTNSASDPVITFYFSTRRRGPR